MTNPHAAHLLDAYARVRDALLDGRIQTCDLTDDQHAGLWLHAFGDGDRALAVLDGSGAQAKRAYRARWPTLRDLLLQAADGGDA